MTVELLFKETLGVEVDPIDIFADQVVVVRSEKDLT